jgi:glycosyltransferase involved in cell wall biosynthesis
MPRILFLSKSPPYRDTGAESILWAVATELAAHDWEVHFLCPAGRNPPEIDNITFHKIRTPDSFFAEKAAFFIKAGPEFWRLRTDLDIDIIYDNSSPLPFPYAYILNTNNVITKVHAFYGSDAFRDKHHPLTKIGTYLGENLYRFIDGSNIIAVSESTKKRLKSIVKKNSSKIIVNQNGIRTDDFNYSFSPEGPVLSLCELTPRKNIGTLLRSWAHLESEGLADRELIIAGDGPSRHRLEELSKNLCSKDVTFRGHVSDAVKKRLLREAFIYVLPTTMEGFGLSNLEAMASGCVVLSTDVPGVRDYIIHGQNGFKVKRGNDRELAEKLGSIIKQPELHNSIAKNARETAEKYHINDTVVRERKILEEFLTLGEHQNAK